MDKSYVRIDPKISPDGDGVVQEHYAIVYSPNTRRKRFPEGNVQICEDRAEALKGADAEQHLYAAEVVGPSKSSEGCRLYYLSRWIG